MPAVAVLAVSLACTAGCAGMNPMGGQAIQVPEPDGSACYDQGRRQFYVAAQQAVAAEDRRQSLEGAGRLMNSRFGDLVMGQIPGGSALRSLKPLLDDLVRYANEDTQLIQAVSYGFDDLVRCRRDEVARLRSDVRARRIGRAEAREKADEIKRLAVIDAAVARDVNAKLRARNLRLDTAARSLENEPVPSDPGYGYGPGPRRTERTEVRANAQSVRQTVQTNQRALATQATNVDRSVEERNFQVSST